jgi:hypothetical protein
MAMKKKRLLKIAIWMTSSCVVLIGVLLIHIYMVTRPIDYGANATIQMSRIDFKQPVAATEVIKIQAFVKQLPGVKNAVFNTDSGILIYTYQNEQQNSLNVYTKLMNYRNYKAERFVVTASQASNGCPVMNDKNSFNGKLTAYISHLFK